MDDELERFKREINLTEFAASRGYQLDRRESSRSSVVMRNAATDDKIIVARRDIDRHWTYFSVRDSRDNGTVVDFLQHRERLTLGQVRKELRQWIGGLRPSVPPELFRPTVHPQECNRAVVQRVFDLAREDENSLYLNSRGIRPATLRHPRFARTFRVDARGNVLFPHRDDAGVSGFESKNRGWTAFAAGGTKTVWRSHARTDDAALVLTEGAIDALSYHQLRSDERTRYISTSGSLSDHQRRAIARAITQMPEGSAVVLAFDNDAGGDRLETDVRQLAKANFARDRSPVGKDWNDCLKTKERDYIRSITCGRALERSL